MTLIMPSPEMVLVFASTTLKLHDGDYALVSLPLSMKEKALDSFKFLDPFTTVSVDTEEVSLILRDSDWQEIKEGFGEHEYEAPYRVITFDIVLDLSLVGFLSVVSAILAEEGISIYAVSTYLRDHILVKSSDVEKTINVLKSLIQRCKAGKDQ